MVGYTSMALDSSNSSNLEQLALKGLNSVHSLSMCWMQQLLTLADCIRVILCECVNMHHILILQGILTFAVYSVLFQIGVYFMVLKHQGW